MDQLTTGNSPRGNLIITGSSNAGGGVYDKIKIVGEGTIDGDVDCSSLKCVGTMGMEGRLQASRIKIVGTCSISGDVRSGDMKISGTASINGEARLKQLHCAGDINIQGDLYSDQLKLRGQLSTKGDCEAEVFTGNGIFEIGGLLNAGQLDIKLYRDCRAKEIGGEKITIRKASSLNPFNFFFKPSSHARLYAAVIEGDELYLENTKAEVVRGNRVTIGAGCDIGLVEYKEQYQRMKGSNVAEERRV